MHVIAKCKVYVDVFEIILEKNVFSRRGQTLKTSYIQDALLSAICGKHHKNFPPHMHKNCLNVNLQCKLQILADK